MIAYQICLPVAWSSRASGEEDNIISNHGATRLPFDIVSGHEA